MSRSDKTLGLVEVRALEPYRIWLRYDDGVEGELDLSYLAGDGVFAAWEDHSFFSAVRLGPCGSIVWGDDLDLCGDALYLKLTGMTSEELFPEMWDTNASGPRRAISPAENGHKSMIDAARWLAWLRDRLDRQGRDFVHGYVLHTGPNRVSLGDRLTLLPMEALWT